MYVAHKKVYRTIEYMQEAPNLKIILFVANFWMLQINPAN